MVCGESPSGTSAHERSAPNESDSEEQTEGIISLSTLIGGKLAHVDYDPHDGVVAVTGAHTTRSVENVCAGLRLRGLDFLGKVNCWRCQQQEPELASTLVRALEHAKMAIPGSPGFEINGSLYIPRCKACREIEDQTMKKTQGEVFKSVGIPAIIVLALTEIFFAIVWANAVAMVIAGIVIIGAAAAIWEFDAEDELAVRLGDAGIANPADPTRHRVALLWRERATKIDPLQLP